MRQKVNAGCVYPLTLIDGRVDRRYRVGLEYCGYEQPRWVLRFCDDWVDSFRNLPDAVLRAVGHRNVLHGAEIITEQRNDADKLRTS